MSHSDEVTIRLEDDGRGWSDVFAQAGSNYPLYEDERFVGVAPNDYLQKRVHYVGKAIAETTLRTIQQIRRLSNLGWPDKKASRRRKRR